jgi:hypothetical protein
MSVRLDKGIKHTIGKPSVLAHQEMRYKRRPIHAGINLPYRKDRPMIRKLLKPLVVAARDGSVALVTLPAEANVEFDPVPDDSLTDDDLTEVLCDGDTTWRGQKICLTRQAPRCW